MPKFIEDFLNRTTMYRVVLYYLILLWLVAFIFAVFGILPFVPLMMFCSLALVIAVCWAVNTFFAKVFSVPANVESVYITAFILALIITPLKSVKDLASLQLLVFAAVLAMASKYVIAIRKKHIFNPAAFAVAVTALALNQYASWWVGGNLPLLPFVLLGGILVVKKILCWDLVLSFLAAAAASSIGFGLARGTDVFTVVTQIVLHSSAFFFAFVMLTEPMTTPPKRWLRICYGVLVGLLFSPAVHVGTVHSTPELVLLVGNVFAYLVSPKRKLILKLEKKSEAAKGVNEFVFRPDRKLAYQPGQYMEWTLGHKNPDSRGNRRYFTIASSPTEPELRLGVKFYPESSSFKRSLLAMDTDKEIVASQLAGEFVLPKDKSRKLVFIAGGIGVTPFRSMIKYLLDKGESRPIQMLYANRTPADIAYKDIWDEASERLGIRTIHVLSETDSVPSDWSGRTGRIDGKMIAEEIPDYRDRWFYISGPRSMVIAAEAALKDIGVPPRRIKTDFFPGFA